jgi:CDP-diacylglycerol---glycerol-3-phosphate 3-phosphatidyltransferase
MQGLVNKLKELEAISVPKFRALEDCDEFYRRIEELLSCSAEAYIASLYFGETGRMVRLMDILECRKKKRLLTYILLDKNRSHDFIKSETLRQRNLESMFHYVDHTRFGILSCKVNEAMKVFHSKALVFDDTVIISGANMDSSYLERRIDR